MPRATDQNGFLRTIDKCDILIGEELITFRILPEISESHSAKYNDEPIIGRSIPIKTFSYGDNRSISMKVHFVTLEEKDTIQNLRWLRALQSLTYPQDDNDIIPYLPPPIAKIRCGQLFTSENEGYVCVILDQYQVSFPTDVMWDEKLLLPWKFAVDLTWTVVFSSTNLPGSNKILKDVPKG